MSNYMDRYADIAVEHGYNNAMDAWADMHGYGEYAAYDDHMELALCTCQECYECYHAFQLNDEGLCECCSGECECCLEDEY